MPTKADIDLMSEQLYQKTTGSGVKYSISPPGDLDVIRLIEGKSKIWRTLHSVSRKPKKLILTDWRNISPSRKKIINKLKKTHTIYIHQSGKLVPINEALNY